MSYYCDIEVKELELKIPKEDFPMESDCMIGYKDPHFLYPEDEGSYRELLRPISDGNSGFIFKVTPDKPLWMKEGDNYCIETLEELCTKYKGTLIAEITGEEPGDMEFIRIRDGKKKKVRIIEEE